MLYGVSVERDSYIVVTACRLIFMYIHGGSLWQRVYMGDGGAMQMFGGGIYIHTHVLSSFYI